METLSHRAQKAGEHESKLLKAFMNVQKNIYDDELNPNGICNCGVAENYLCENELLSKLQTIQVWKRNNLYYPDSTGELVLRQVLCQFFQRLFQLNYQLDPNRMIISSGLSGIISLLGYLLGDRDDVFLIASPYYTAFDHDIAALTNCATFPCPLLEQENGNFILSVEVFERGYTKAISQGLQPRGIIIINPHNPTGDVYDEQTIQPILKFASERNLHMIMDEIYAFSRFENENKFQSILNSTSIIDPERTHFVWSLSKDFSLSGLRLGVLYAGSKELCQAGTPINFIQVPSSIIQSIIAVMLSDNEWIDSYIKLNRSRLTQQYEKMKKSIENIDNRIYIRPSKAGFFIWTDFHLLLREVTFEEEMRLFQFLMDNGIYITPGSLLSCSQPGWFRIIFCVKENWINEVLKRLKLGLDMYQQSTIDV